MSTEVKRSTEDMQRNVCVHTQLSPNNNQIVLAPDPKKIQRSYADAVKLTSDKLHTEFDNDNTPLSNERSTGIDNDDVPNWLDALGHCVAGGFAGIVSMALIYPIDTMKTRMQVRKILLDQYLL